MSITREEIYKRVRKVVAEELSISHDEITETASYTQDLGADSLDTVELVLALEDEFGVEIGDDQAEKLTTIEKTIDYIVSKSS
jgi:acyl carrier protein